MQIRERDGGHYGLLQRDRCMHSVFGGHEAEKVLASSTDLQTLTGGKYVGYMASSIHHIYRHAYICTFKCTVFICMETAWQRAYIIIVIIIITIINLHHQGPTTIRSTRMISGPPGPPSIAEGNCHACITIHANTCKFR
jgi:hypothetical protein